MSHITNAAPKKKQACLGTPEIQHVDINSNNSQIEDENRDDELNFAGCKLSFTRQRYHTKEDMTYDINMAYNDV